MSPEEARNVGLVDKISSLESIQSDAAEMVKKFAAIPPSGRVRTKLILRQELADWLKINQQKDTEAFVAQVLNPQTQTDIGNYIKKLKGK